MSMQLITEDQYTPPAIYDSEPRTFTKEEIGTRSCWRLSALW